MKIPLIALDAKERTFLFNALQCFQQDYGWAWGDDVNKTAEELLAKMHHDYDND